MPPHPIPRSVAYLQSSDPLLAHYVSSVTLDATPPVGVTEPELAHLVKVDDVKKTGDQQLTPGLPLQPVLLEVAAGTFVILPPPVDALVVPGVHRLAITTSIISAGQQVRSDDTVVRDSLAAKRTTSAPAEDSFHAQEAEDVRAGKFDRMKAWL